MGEFKLKDAIDLLYKQTTIINSLWMAYAVVCLTAGGFSALNGDAGVFEQRLLTAISVSTGLGAFTFGHWRMLRGEIAARWSLSQEIESALVKEPLEDSPVYFRKSLRLSTRAVSQVYQGLIVHGAIDTCVFAVIWVRLAIPHFPILLR